MSAEPLSFLVADDHPMVRDALVSALGQAFAGATFATADTLPRVQAALDSQPETDALLLDLDMPGMDGLTGLGLLRAGYPTVPIIVVSAARDAAVPRRAYELGATGRAEPVAILGDVPALRALVCHDVPPVASLPRGRTSTLGRDSPRQYGTAPAQVNVPNHRPSLESHRK